MRFDGRAPVHSAYRQRHPTEMALMKVIADIIYTTDK